MDDADCMRLAIKKAHAGIKKGQSPFGACISKNGKAIAADHNRVWEKCDPAAHAEIVTIAKACKKLGTINLQGCTIYSTCEPCPMCFSACHWARISKVVYGARIEDAKKIGFHEFPIHDTTLRAIGKCRIEIVGDFLAEECLELFRTWAARRDRQSY